MAVYCGVCATRIFSAADNEGSFRVASHFAGWDGARISDTCESCAEALRRVIADKANELAKDNKKAVTALRRQVEKEKHRQELATKEKADFEREWRSSRAVPPPPPLPQRKAAAITTGDTTPSPALRAAVDALVRAHGVLGTSSMLGGVSRESVVRIVAGAPVRAGTIARVTNRLGELAEDAERCGGSLP